MHHSPSGKPNSRIYPRVKAGIEHELSLRRSTIVRPWEIDAQACKLNDLMQGVSHKLIQLAPTSTKYKEQIINMAQKNSPAPEMFPKFNFHDNDEPDVSATPVVKVTPDSQPTISLSPRSPEVAETENIDSPIRPRSDSEETLSADELESKESIHSLNTNDDSPKTVSALLMERLNELPADKLGDGIDIDEECLKAFGDVKLGERANSPDIVLPLISDHLESPVPGTETLKIINRPDDCRFVARTSPMESCVFATSQVEGGEGNVFLVDRNQSTEKRMKRSSPCQKDEVMMLYDKTVRKMQQINGAPSRQDHINNPIQDAKHDPKRELEKNTNVERETEIAGYATEEKETRPESPDIYDDLKVHHYDEQPSSNSPFDFYSDIKSNADDELIKISTFKDSPNNDALFLYARDHDDELQKEETAEETATPLDSKESCEQNPREDDLTTTRKDDDDVDDEIVKITSGKELSNETRSDAGTPVMDEPANLTSLLAMKASFDVAKRKDKQDQQDTSLNTETSPGSTPEARTPLLDEPEYHFESVMENMSTAFAPYNRPSMPDETASTGSQTRIDYLRVFGKMDTKQEAFESITPPSSPENEHCSSSRAQAVSSAVQTTTSVAFPFSALAFNVHSRPSSRAGSSCHSPLPQGDRSPKSEKTEIPLPAPKHRSMKSCDRETDSPYGLQQSLDLSRIQKRDFRRSGSQSSSSSFSKSPEYEFKQRKSFTDRHIEQRESNRKQKRESSSPGVYDGNYNKRPRT